MTEENKVFFTLSWKVVDKLMKKLDKKKVPYLYISEWGAVPVNCNDNALVKFVVDVSEGETCYFASVHFLNRSKDGVFVKLLKPNETPRKMPEFKDVFKMVEI